MPDLDKAIKMLEELADDYGLKELWHHERFILNALDQLRALKHLETISQDNT